jgi:hypothetical protein
MRKQRRMNGFVGVIFMLCYSFRRKKKYEHGVLLCFYIWNVVCLLFWFLFCESEIEMRRE